MIHEIKKLIGDEGMIVLYYVPFDPAEGECRFQGVVHMYVPEEGGLIPIEFEFPSSVKTPQEAFAVFKETARAHAKTLREQAEAPRILTPKDFN